jgi:hypothetical protein
VTRAVIIVWLALALAGCASLGEIYGVHCADNGCS